MFHTFPKSISEKVYVIAGPGFELAYLEAGVEPFSHHTVRIPSLKFLAEGLNTDF